MRWILPERGSPLSGHQLHFLHAGTTKVLKVQLNIREKRSSLSPKLQTSTPGPSEAAMYLLPVFDFPALSCLLCFQRTCGCSRSWYRVLIIKFDLCVCFDYCLALTSEAPKPWGICQSPNSGGGGGDCSGSSSVCLCSLCMCLFAAAEVSSCQRRNHGVSQQRRAGSVKKLVEFWKMKRGMTAGKVPGNVWPQTRSCQLQTQRSAHRANEYLSAVSPLAQMIGGKCRTDQSGWVQNNLNFSSASNTIHNYAIRMQQAMLLLWPACAAI